MASPNDIRKGNVIQYNGAPHLVLESMHRTPGNLRSFVQVTMRNLKTGSTTTQKLQSSFDPIFMETDTRQVELSYQDQDGLHFMDPKTFEDIIIDPALASDAMKFLQEGQMVDILFVDGLPTQVQLPASVVLEVTEAPDAIKGDTSGAATKPVTTATGLVVQTPLFIKTGERIKVSTDTGAYMGRA